MNTRNKGTYDAGFYYISPESSHHSLDNNQSRNNLDQNEFEDFVQEVNYETLCKLNYKSKFRPYCSIRLKCSSNLADH